MLVRNFIHAITKLQHEMKMPTRLQECKISIEDINKLKQEITRGALEDACIITNQS